MKKNYTLLIVDRNPYIRSFLKREMSAVGYDIGLAGNGRQTIERVNSVKPPDLLILDPDLPDTEGIVLFQQLYAHMPNIPVVVHTLSSEYEKYSGISGVAACIEKSGE